MDPEISICFSLFCILEGDADTEEKLTNFKSTNIDIGKDNSIFSIEDHEPIRGIFLYFFVREYAFCAHVFIYAFW